MTALSIMLPDKIAQASQHAAKRLGISRTAFIRLAIQHELENLARQEEQKQIAQALLAMQGNKDYQKEVDDLDNTDFPSLPNDEDEWWKL